MDRTSLSVRHRVAKFWWRVRRRSLKPTSWRWIAAGSGSFLAVIIVAWLALGESKLTTAGKEPGKDFGIDTTVVRLTGDTIHFFMRPYYRIQNRRFRSGHISRCDVAPIALEFSPPVVAAAVNSTRIPPLSSRTVGCEVHFKLALGVRYPRPEWQLALFAEDGAEVIRTRLYMPLLPGCRTIEFDARTLNTGNTLGLLCDHPQGR